MRLIRACLWASLVGLLLPAAAPAQDWPCFLGPNRDGVAVLAGVNKDWAAKPPAILWRVPIFQPSFSGPIAADGKLFILDHKGADEIVRALDLKTGKDLWSVTYPDTASNNYGFARSSPAYDEGVLFTISRLGVAHALSAKDGTILWKRDVVTEFKGRRPGWDLAGSPLVDGPRLLLTPGGPDALLVALDKKTGKTLWASGADGVGYSTPTIATIAGKRQYVLFSGKSVAGYEPDGGKLIWQAPWITAHNVNAALPLILEDKVFVTSSYNRGGGVFKVAGAEAEKVWENREMQSHFSSPILHKGHIYGTTDPGDLVCIEFDTGKCVWRQKGFEKGTVIAVDGTLIAMDGRGGDLVQVELSPAGYKELGRLKAPLGGRSWTAPIIAQGMLIIRNEKEIACLALK